MKKLLSLVLLAWGGTLPLQAQTFVLDPRPVPETICPARPENMFTQKGPPAAFKATMAGERRLALGSKIEVEYSGFTPEAQAAFQHAVDIWQSLLNSPVTIHVKANWTPLAAGVLGSAGASAYYSRIDGATKSDVSYPVALAEKIAGRDLNSAASADINANFSSTFNWYYGLDGNTPAGKYDLVTVVLHELGHGLGFIAGTNYSTTTKEGAYGTTPINFTTYIENAAGQKISDVRLFTNPSTGLGAQLVSNALYFNSPLAQAANTTATVEKRPRLYAPATYSSGSSISHLDEATYPAGNPNSLMSPQVGAAEAIHDPGPLTLAIFNEMGWFNTAIRHTPFKDTETAQDFVVNATVQSDGTITPGSVKLVYSIDGGTEVTLAMASVGAGQYRATIPNPGLGKTVRYYLTASDVETGRAYAAPAVTRRGVINRYEFFVGPDVKAPVVQLTSPSFVFVEKLPYTLVVKAKDNLGISSVVLEYNVNGTARPSLPLSKFNDSIYVATLSTAGGPLVSGDIINYRIVATDIASTTPNRTVNPVSGFYAVRVVAFKAPQASFASPLNSEAPLDFVGDGFSIRQEPGFTSPAINSDHPYRDGTGSNFQSNIIYQLLVPIIVNADAAKAQVKFDEIVLTEPNDAGSLFGEDGFYDYVVVEGSKDGENWVALTPGYSSRENAAWLARWNSAVDGGGNSTAVGTPDLYAPRTLNLQPTFAAGDVVRLRFRLFSDQLSHGWGWAIDNLAIQSVVTGVAEDLKASGLSVYPNPSTGQFTVAASFLKPVKDMQVVVRNMLGQEVLRKTVRDGQREVAVPLNMSSFSAGLYQVSLTSGSESVTRKVLLQK